MAKSRRATTEPDEFEGYRAGDVTYCVDPKTDCFFPVRVARIGKGWLEVVSLNDALTDAVAPDFGSERANRRFVRPLLPNKARFGGFDERTVNADRKSGQELRLLPFHYATFTNAAIKQRNASDPRLWPLPTGIVYERWFRQEESGT